jgi:molecular chaperone DnaK
VSLDIDANGILQVTAMDRTTGREQTVTIQGASSLGDLEVKRAIEEAAQFAASDKQKRDKVDKRNRAEALTYQAERQLREVALEFGMQFANSQRKQIEALVRELREALADGDERLIDEIKTELDEAIYDFTRQVRALTEEEDKGILGTLKEIFVGDDDDYSYRDNYNGRDPYDTYGSQRDPYYNDYSRGALPPQDYNRRPDYSQGSRDPYTDRANSRNNPNSSRDYEDRYTRDARYPERQDDRYSANPRRPPANDGYVDRSRQRDDNDYFDDTPTTPRSDRWDDDRTATPARRPVDRSTPREPNSADSRQNNPRADRDAKPTNPSERRNPSYPDELEDRREVRRARSESTPPTRRPNSTTQPIRDDWDDDDEWY